MNIAVIYGGISTERNVSIAGGKAVIEVLRERGHNVVPIDPAFGADGARSELQLTSIDAVPSLEELAGFTPRNLINCINSELFDNIDCAFIVLHGKYGEDGFIQALLEMRGIPYTGSNVKSSALAMDKLHSKMIFIAAGIPTPPWITVRPDKYEDYDFIKEIRSELGGHLVIKPNNQGSTIGVTIVEKGNLDDILFGIAEAAKYSSIVIVEKFIEGREITVGIVGEDVLPVIEIIPEEGFYDYKHKYTKGHTEYECPADLPEELEEFIQNLADTAYRALGCYGFGRVDFRLDEDNQPFCLEVNTIPGFTSTSLVPMAAKEVDLEFGEICENIIELALEIKKKELK